MTGQDSYTLPQRTLRGLDRTDAMSPDLRECVHEFGTEIVEMLVAMGVTQPNRIRTVVHGCWMGARQPLQRNLVGSMRTPVMDSLDWLLVQSGSNITAATLVRVLFANGMAILPLEPSTVMQTASMDAIKGMGLLNKPEKHRIRLRAAIRQGAARLWPHLFAVGNRNKG